MVKALLAQEAVAKAERVAMGVMAEEMVAISEALVAKERGAVREAEEREEAKEAVLVEKEGGAVVMEGLVGEAGRVGDSALEAEVVVQWESVVVYWVGKAVVAGLGG